MAIDTIAGNPAGNYTQELESIKETIERMKADKMKAEVTKENLEKQRIGILDEVRALGVDPDQLDAEIAKLDNAIKTNLAEINQLIPDKYRS